MSMGAETINHLATTMRRTFRESGMSLKRLADQTETPYASVHGFFGRGDRDAALSTVERWCKALGLELRPVRRRKSKA